MGYEIKVTGGSHDGHIIDIGNEQVYQVETQAATLYTAYVRQYSKDRRYSAWMPLELPLPILAGNIVDPFPEVPFPGFYSGIIPVKVRGTDTNNLATIEVLANGVSILEFPCSGIYQEVVFDWDTTLSSATGSTEDVTLTLNVINAVSEIATIEVLIPIQNDVPPSHYIWIFNADLEASDYFSGDAMGLLTDRGSFSHNAEQTVRDSKPRLQNTIYGNFIQFETAQFMTLPDYSSFFEAQEAQLYLVMKADAYCRMGRFLGGDDGIRSEVYDGHIYEPFASLVRKDDITPDPHVVDEWVVYRVRSANGFYEMSVNGNVFFTTTLNVFSSTVGDGFIIGDGLGGDNNISIKYAALLNNILTDDVSALMSEFDIS